MPRLLPLLALLIPTIALAESAPLQQFTYAVSVSFGGGKCIFQTGDVLMNAKQFRYDLKDRFDPKNRLLIYYSKSSPVKCLRTATKIATGIGFRVIQAEVVPANLDFGPPR